MGRLGDRRDWWQYVVVLMLVVAAVMMPTPPEALPLVLVATVLILVWGLSRR